MMTYFKTGRRPIWNFPEKRVLLLGLAALLAGCSTPYTDTLPTTMAEHIEHSVTFSQIKESPENFKGKLVLLGGQVLEAKRLKDSTQLIILQLPLINDQEPTTELTQSKGRFIAEQEEFLDPATVPPGSRITLVGELSGSIPQSLDETVYTYPTLSIKHFKIWPDYPSDYNRYGSYYRYPYLYPYPFASPYWGRFNRFYPYYPYWYW